MCVVSYWTNIFALLNSLFRSIVGPFINDALAGLGKISTGEFSQLAEYCTNKTQEIEADIVSARYVT